jgi:enamine deaminase RidA (YjgF/YER057c/UK114 family)
MFPTTKTMIACCLLLATAAPAAAQTLIFGTPRPRELDRYFSGSTLPSNPFLANGVGVGEAVAYYTAAGTGPTGSNSLAPSGTPARFINYTLLETTHPTFFPTDADKAAGVLPAGVSITEAQGLSTLAAVQANLAAAGLTMKDIVFMRILLDNVEGEARADYAGWNDAYRKYMANVDLNTGQVISNYAPVLFENATRPARSNFEVGTLPVLGWLVEIEVVAAYPTYVECYVPFKCLK